MRTPPQAKLDLTSVMEGSAAEGKKSDEAKAMLEAARAELAETKMRLESETAANAGLKAAVMEANQVCIYMCCVVWATTICVCVCVCVCFFFLLFCVLELILFLVCG